MMNQDYLDKQIRKIAQLPQDGTKYMSLFFDFQAHPGKEAMLFKAWAYEYRIGLDRVEAMLFDDALQEALEFLEDYQGVAKSGAIYISLEEIPQVKFMLFDAPMESQYYLFDYPVIYPLVELRDKFERFVLVALSSQKAHIIEIDLGKTSLELISQREEAKLKSGREWTKEHYLNAKKERGKKFLKEKIELLRQISEKNAHCSIILAGEPRFVNRLKKALPQPIARLVVDEVKSGVGDAVLHDIIEQSKASYLKAEHQQSLNSVEQIIQNIHTNGLASTSLQGCLQALEYGNAQLLLLSKQLEQADREKLLKQASISQTAIETVENSDKLDALGGAGVILRYKTPPLSESKTMEIAS